MMTTAIQCGCCLLHMCTLSLSSYLSLPRLCSPALRHAVNAKINHAAAAHALKMILMCALEIDCLSKMANIIPFVSVPARILAIYTYIYIYTT